MLIGNILIGIFILVLFMTLVLTAGVVFFFVKNKKPKKIPSVVMVENLPKDISEGFGYVKGKSVVLNEHGIPYLYKTYREAENNMQKVKGVNKIIHQKWDLTTQTLVVRDIINGTIER